MSRPDGRRADQLRPLKIMRAFTELAPGSVLICQGRTRVLCTACWEVGVPDFLVGSGRGWVTAEYDMLPSATGQRRRRDGRTGKIDGRSQEIQRLIGRTMRSVVDMAKLGENTIWLDCDVLQADGGTRTAAINGAYVALADALTWANKQGFAQNGALTEAVAAVSVGLVGGKVLLDLDYSEDSAAEVDMNVAMTSAGKFVELQGSAETATFDRQQLDKMLNTAGKGIRQLLTLQKNALAQTLKRKNQMTNE